MIILGEDKEALYNALVSVGVKKDDEVLVSNLSPESTSQAIKMTGASPVFTSIDISTLHMSISSVRKLWGPKKQPRDTNKTKVKAIVYTHPFGLPCEEDKIEKFCEKKGCEYIEYGGVEDVIVSSHITKKYDDKLKGIVEIYHAPNNYIIKLKNENVRDVVKNKLGLDILILKTLAEYEGNEGYRKENKFLAKEVCNTTLSLPTDLNMADEEIDTIINTVIDENRR